MELTWCQCHPTALDFNHSTQHTVNISRFTNKHILSLSGMSFVGAEKIRAIALFAMAGFRNNGRWSGDSYDFVDVGFDPLVVINHPEANLAGKIFRISVSAVG